MRKATEKIKLCRCLPQDFSSFIPVGWQSSFQITEKQHIALKHTNSSKDKPPCSKAPCVLQWNIMSAKCKPGMQGQAIAFCNSLHLLVRIELTWLTVTSGSIRPPASTRKPPPFLFFPPLCSTAPYRGPSRVWRAFNYTCAHTSIWKGQVVI